MVAAREFAREIGGTTLEMTKAGQRLERITEGMDWFYAKPLWEAASRSFARGATGPVYVILNGSRPVSTQSVWYQIERPLLERQGNQINYYYTTPSGGLRMP